jgi:hypothetical protein
VIEVMAHASKKTQDCAPCSDTIRDRKETPFYVEAENVVIKPLNGGHHSCACDGGNQ